MEMPINALNRIINLTGIFWAAGSDDDAHFLHWLREGNQDPERLLDAIGDHVEPPTGEAHRGPVPGTMGTDQ